MALSWRSLVLSGLQINLNQVERDVTASGSGVFVWTCNSLFCLCYTVPFGKSGSGFDNNFFQNMTSDAACFCKRSCNTWAIKFLNQSGVSYNFRQAFFEYLCLFRGLCLLKNPTDLQCHFD